MSKINILVVAKRGLSSLWKGIKKHRNDICFGVGVAGSIGTAIWAFKRGETYDHAQSKAIEEIDMDIPEEEYNDAVKKAVRIAKIKHVGPVIGAGLVSAGLTVTPYVKQAKTLVKVTAALVALEETARAGNAEPLQLTEEEIMNPPIEENDEAKLEAMDLAEKDLLEARRLGFGECAIKLENDWGGFTERRNQLITQLIHLEEVTQDRFQARPEFGLFYCNILSDLGVDLMERFRRQIILSQTYGWYGDTYVDFGLRVGTGNGNWEYTPWVKAFLECKIDYLWLNPNVKLIIDKI